MKTKFSKLVKFSMLKWSRSKAQFFIISMVVIMAILIGIQNFFAGYYQIDLTKPYKRQEDFWFWDIKTQVIRAIRERSCPELESDFVEIKMVTENYLAKKGIEFVLENTTPICIGNNKNSPSIGIAMNMTSSNVKLSEKFDVPT